MAYCYLCGRHIEKGRHLRRKVRTGEYINKHCHRQRLRTVTIRFGWRIVCSSCGRYLDESAKASMQREISSALLWACGLAFLIAILNQVD
jgi:hypothetical protein